MEIRLSSGAEKLTIFQIESFLRFLVEQMFAGLLKQQEQKISKYYCLYFIRMPVLKQLLLTLSSGRVVGILLGQGHHHHQLLHSAAKKKFDHFWRARAWPEGGAGQKEGIQSSSNRQHSSNSFCLSSSESFKKCLKISQKVSLINYCG